MTEDLLGLTAEIVTAHVSNNDVSTAELPTLIRATYDALEKAASPAATQAPALEPAVSIRASVKPDYIVCLEDGHKLTMLKRYLRTRFDMSPDDYRAKWGLPKDYPMVAPNYAETRRTLAKSIGLGGKGKNVIVAATTATHSVEATIRSASDRVEAAAEPVVAAVKAGRKKLGIAAAKAQAVAHLGGTDTPAPTPAKPRVAKTVTKQAQ